MIATIYRLAAMAVLLSMSGGAAHADQWRTLLQISCAPEVSHFSVRTTGTWNFDAPVPDGFVAIDSGVTQSRGSPVVEAPGSAELGKCDLSASSGIVFEVVRTHWKPPADCSGCGMFEAELEIRLNGKAIVTGGAGGDRFAPRLRDLLFDGEQFLTCNTRRPFDLRTPTSEVYSIECKSERALEYLQR